MKKKMIGLAIALFCIGIIGMAVAIVNLNKDSEPVVSEEPVDEQPQVDSGNFESLGQTNVLDDSEEWSSELETIEGKFATTTIEDLRFYAYTTRGITVKSWEFKNLDTSETVRDGLNFYASRSTNAMDPGAYTIENGQINVADDWFTAQISKANGAKNFELSVTYSGMYAYETNGHDGRIGISFKIKGGKQLYFDLMEQNKEYYFASLKGEVNAEKGWTKQAVNDEITLKLKRNGNQYTMTCGDQEWNFVFSSSGEQGSSTNEETTVWTPPFVLE